MRTVAQLRGAWPDLCDRSVVALDLRYEDFDWASARFGRTTFLGCRFPLGVGEQLLRAGVGVLHAPDNLPFDPFRTDLYSYDELIQGERPNLDERIAGWFAASTMDVYDEVFRAIHDATMTAAVARYVTHRRIVGIMGSHAIPRGDRLYRKIAVLGRTLTRAGFTVATGGGPGIMEAANLGAWLAPSEDRALEDALAILAEAPDQDTHPKAYQSAAAAVRGRWPGDGGLGGESLGVPTFLYINEATTGFATHIAKFFAYGIREDGLLAIARSGVVYAPGRAGTEQELFSDSAQNSLTLYDVRSPVVLFDSDYFERERSELLTALRHQATAFGWEGLLAVLDDPEDVLDFVQSHDPDRLGAAGMERRRSRRDPPDVLA